MKRINNKGFTLVEVIIASTMALVVAYFLINITVKMVSKNNDYYIESILIAEKTVITKEIMDDFNDNTLAISDITYDGVSKLTITFEDGDNKILDIDTTNKTISYGQYKNKLNDNTQIGTLSIEKDETNNVLKINLPIYTNYSDKDYGLKLILKYDPTITTINIPELPTPGSTEPEIFYFRERDSYYECTLSGGSNSSYILETWGAQGGIYDETSAGSVAGYSVGTLALNNDTTVYIYVGEQGKSYDEAGINNGGFNGGGNGGSAGGGGASDIRIGNNSLYSRVIVAGGGGGAADEGGRSGAGGGETGGNGKYEELGSLYECTGGGTISSGGQSCFNLGFEEWVGEAGKFGIGGNANMNVTSEDYPDNVTGVANYSGGGGGGWYGGGAGGVEVSYISGGVYDNDTTGGGGGSGWVLTEDNYKKWKSENNIDPKQYKLVNFENNTSNYYLDEAITKSSANECIPSAHGNTNANCEIGKEKHLGDGLVKITPQGSGKIKNCQWIDKDNNKTNYPNPSTETKTFYEGLRKCLIYPGKYKFEVWGAQGGGTESNPDAGGKGGYSTANITIKKKELIHLYVGGMGDYHYIQGGFNGGGYDIVLENGPIGSSGGGASDIRILDKYLTYSYDETLYSRVIVAGGGGSSSYHEGGYGGGENGEDGKIFGNYSNYAAKGATIYSGGAGGFSEGNKNVIAGENGTFGKGGNIIYSLGQWSGAGGGGWYGGGSSAVVKAPINSLVEQYTSGGGGGSGWVLTEDNYKKWKSENSNDSDKYKLVKDGESEFWLTNAYTKSGNETFKNDLGIEENGHSGNGVVKITHLSNLSNGSLTGLWCLE